DLTIYTVKDHLKAIFAKLDVGGRAELSAKLGAAFLGRLAISGKLPVGGRVGGVNAAEILSLRRRTGLGFRAQTDPVFRQLSRKRLASGMAREDRAEPIGEGA